MNICHATSTWDRQQANEKYSASLQDAAQQLTFWTAQRSVLHITVRVEIHAALPVQIMLTARQTTAKGTYL